MRDVQGTRTDHLVRIRGSGGCGSKFSAVTSCTPDAGLDMRSSGRSLTQELAAASDGETKLGEAATGTLCARRAASRAELGAERACGSAAYGSRTLEHTSEP